MLVNNYETEENKKQIIYLLFIIVIGVTLRMIMPIRGHNFDVESYRIVADIISQGGNVYSETSRYNYGPVWFYILHILDLLPWGDGNKVIILHWKVATFLTAVDIGICLALFRSYNYKVAALFFLNPISIIITGYHGQFDNLAILFGLVSVLMLDARKDTYWTWAGLIMLGLSLSVKHILFIFPLWLAFKESRWSRKLLFILIPYSIFLTGFLFYLPDGLQGIIKNVFMYRSFNNTPFLGTIAPGFIYKTISPLLFFITTLIFLGLIWRKKRAVDSLNFYLISLVVFSSAIANQYLAICTPSIATLWNWAYALYTFIGTLFLLVEKNGLHIYYIQDLIGWYGNNGYHILIIPLFIGLLINSVKKEMLNTATVWSNSSLVKLFLIIKDQIKSPW